MKNVLLVLTSASECVNVALFQYSMYFITNISQSYLYQQLHFICHIRTWSENHRMSTNLMKVNLLWRTVPILLLNHLRLNIHKFRHLQMHAHVMCMEGVINSLWQSPCSSTYAITPLHDKTYTCVIGMFTMWICQWLLSQTGMPSCIRNKDILVSRLLKKVIVFLKWK